MLQLLIRNGAFTGVDTDLPNGLTELFGLVPCSWRWSPHYWYLWKYFSQIGVHFLHGWLFKRWVEGARRSKDLYSIQKLFYKLFVRGELRWRILFRLRQADDAFEFPVDSNGRISKKIMNEISFPWWHIIMKYICNQEKRPSSKDIV